MNAQLYISRKREFFIEKLAGFAKNAHLCNTKGADNQILF